MVILTSPFCVLARVRNTRTLLSHEIGINRMGASHMCDAFWGGASIDFNGSVLHYFHPWMHTRIRVVGIVACSFALPLSFSAVLETHVHAEKGIDWFCSRAEGLLFPAGVAIP